MANIREILAKNMKENRQKLGITQAELAERADISINFVAMIELKHKFPSPEVLDRIASAFGIEVNGLFNVVETKEDGMESLQKAILDNLDQAIEEAVDKAIDKKMKSSKCNSK